MKKLYTWITVNLAIIFLLTNLFVIRLYCDNIEPKEKEDEFITFIIDNKPYKSEDLLLSIGKAYGSLSMFKKSLDSFESQKIDRNRFALLRHILKTEIPKDSKTLALIETKIKSVKDPFLKTELYIDMIREYAARKSGKRILDIYQRFLKKTAL
ncbi:MAG: hypothetical protein GY757_26860, partial [bacterium]|nr:hypothetical protein [bacterium]